MRIRWSLLVALVASSVAVATTSLTAQSEDEAVARIRQQLVGSYRLVSFVSTDPSGKETLSPYRIGQISYDASGRMSAQLMYGERVSFTAGTPPTEAQRAAAYSSYLAYFGRYVIDAKARTVTHHVEGSTNPSLVSTPLVRHFEISPDGNTLYLSVKNGDRVTGRLRWDRHR